MADRFSHNFIHNVVVISMCTRRNLLRRCFDRELNEIESVTNINSSMNMFCLPVNEIACEITQAYNGARSLTELPSALRDPPLFYRTGNSIDIVNQLFD